MRKTSRSDRDERSKTILYECRICGLDLPPETEVCYKCGYAEIARYDFD